MLLIPHRDCRRLPPGSSRARAAGTATAGTATASSGTIWFPLAVATVPAQFAIAGSSDAWVHASLQVQQGFERLLLVDGSNTPARSAAVPPLAFDATVPPAPELPRRANLVFATLQEAVDASRGGDVIAVMPGTYQGFVMGKRPGVGQGQYIRMVALGPPGAVKIDRAAPGATDPRWMAYFRTAQYVIFEGFHLVGQSKPGEPAPDTAWAGVFLDGNFGESGEMAHHIALVRLFSHHHARWGMHSTDTHTVLVQDSFFGFSGSQHGAYVSDGSDDYVIRQRQRQGRCGRPQLRLDEPLADPEQPGLRQPRPRHRPVG